MYWYQNLIFWRGGGLWSYMFINHRRSCGFDESVKRRLCWSIDMIDFIPLLWSYIFLSLRTDCVATERPTLLDLNRIILLDIWKVFLTGLCLQCRHCRVFPSCLPDSFPSYRQRYAELECPVYLHGVCCCLLKRVLLTLTCAESFSIVSSVGFVLSEFRSSVRWFSFSYFLRHNVQHFWSVFIYFHWTFSLGASSPCGIYSELRGLSRESPILLRTYRWATWFCVWLALWS